MLSHEGVKWTHIYECTLIRCTELIVFNTAIPWCWHHPFSKPIRVMPCHTVSCRVIHMRHAYAFLPTNMYLHPCFLHGFAPIPLSSSPCNQWVTKMIAHPYLRSFHHRIKEKPLKSKDSEALKRNLNECGGYLNSIHQDNMDSFWRTVRTPIQGYRVSYLYKSNDSKESR
jgi:hypothetical protein